MYKPLNGISIKAIRNNRVPPSIVKRTGDNGSGKPTQSKNHCRYREQRCCGRLRDGARVFRFCYELGRGVLYSEGT